MTAARPGRAGAGRPVVVLVFDEFPLDTLLRPDGTHRRRALPATSPTWPRTPPGSRNAFTIYDSTFKSVPAIMDAVTPRRGTAADYRSHPHSVYTLMDGLGYDVVDVASGEALCPPRICPDVRTRRPGVLKRLAGGGRPPRLHAWIGVDPRARAADLLPPPRAAAARALDLPPVRAPEQPAGQRPDPGDQRAEGLRRPCADQPQRDRATCSRWASWTTRSGCCWRACAAPGCSTDALLVVTADHGYAFEVGVKDRRLVTDRNVDEIAPVPMFVKAPGQTDGE